MRPQQNRRMRGRTNNNPNNNSNNNNNNNNNNNRRGPNPLSRNYESNGPDVKIRGNAQHIADKYTSLARDAQVAGDRVMAENYLQHAEHYTRIILAAQAQMPQPIQRDDTQDDDEDTNDSNNNNNHNGNAQELEQEERRPEQQEPLGSGPQPDIEGMPAEVVFSNHSNGAENNDEDKRQRRPQRRRAPRRVEGEVSDQPAQDKVAEPSQVVEQAPVIAQTESAAVSTDVVEEEKKPRRRRTVKAKVEEEAKV